MQWDGTELGEQVELALTRPASSSDWHKGGESSGSHTGVLRCDGSEEKRELLRDGFCFLHKVGSESLCCRMEARGME